MSDVQLQALRVVLAVLGGRSLSVTLAARMRRGDQHAPAVQDLAYGVLRNLGALREILRRLLDKPLRDDDVEVLLLVGLYQLQYTRAAPHAVVDHAVGVCARLRKGSAKGLINAVLRNFLRNRQALTAQARSSEIGRWSYPRWWIDLLRCAYPEHFEAILDAGSSKPPMTLRVNLRAISCARYVSMLQDQGLQSEQIGTAALRLTRAVPVDRLPGFAQGLVSVQDLAAQHAAGLLDLADGQRVLDACAAPGGKTAHILESAMVALTALDRDQTRLPRVRANLERLSLSAHVHCADAAQLEQWWTGAAFDRILLDAPCSASGITRRHPDVKWLRRPEDLPQLAQQQQRLLDALWRTLAQGGKLLYSTCSVFPIENHTQVARFLQAHPEARLLPLSGIPEGPEIGDIRGQILPGAQHDGFFYALIQKV